MIKICQLLLSSILISSFAVSVTEISRDISTNVYTTNQSRPLYKNVNQDFIDYKADVKKGYGGSNDFHTGATGTIFRWNEYADTWDEFKGHYGSLTLSVNLNIAFNWYNIKWQSSSFVVPLNKITTSNTNWVAIGQVDQKTTQWARKDATHGKVSYACWVSGNNILIRFQLLTWATNHYDNYYYSVDTRKVTCNTTFDYNTVKTAFTKNVSNKTLWLESDYSTSLLDERNKIAEKTALDNLISGGLGDYYPLWKQYIKDYTFDDQTSQATVTVKFIDLNTNQNIMWEFYVVIKFTLTQDYWNKTFKDRLTLTPGMVIDPKSPNQMIKDTPLAWDGKDVYGTAADITFNGAPDGSETMKVNGNPIQVIDNTFTYKMIDNQDEEINEYDILLEKHDLDDFNKILGKYEIKYMIKQKVPNLDLKWYAWDPEKNPDQRKLITPTLPDGKINPDYDREVNVKTGTKTQLVWIKQAAENPFPLDPLDKTGEIIKDKNYEQGYLAEGSVSGMGITQSFADPWIVSVKRVKVDEQTLKPTGNWEVIKADKDGSYFSLSGTYLYVITDQKGFTSNKLIIIGQQWKEKYAKFLDVLNNPAVAVSFWSTTQGFHLKNYLAKYKFLDSKAIQELSFEQVSSYWKEYVSDVNSDRIGPGIDPNDTVDLKNIVIDDIKTNNSDINLLREEIVNKITTKLNDYQLIYQVDYQIDDLEANLKKLIEYQEGHDVSVTLNISALETSIKARNSRQIRVRNSRDYHPEDVIDLSKLKLSSYRYDFSQFSIEELRAWILSSIDKQFTALAVTLVYQADYLVDNLEDETLSQFINTKGLVELTFRISAVFESNLAVGSTTLLYINDPDEQVAPPEPPDPKPDPDPNPPSQDQKVWNQKKSLILMSVIVMIVFASSATIFYFKHRLKKGIGGKKNKQQVAKEKTEEIEKKQS